MDPLAILNRIGRGRLLEELTEALAQVADEVVATGKAGSVTLSLKVSTREQGDEMVTITESIGRKLPARAARGGYLYAVDGGLYATDPRQLELPMRVVDQPAAELRSTEITNTFREA